MKDTYDKFYLFQGDIYYPLGGWLDFKGTFSTPLEAKIAADKDEDNYGKVWAQIVDIDKGITIMRGHHNSAMAFEWETIYEEPIKLAR